MFSNQDHQSSSTISQAHRSTQVFEDPINETAKKFLYSSKEDILRLMAGYLQL